jgi:cellulase
MDNWEANEYATALTPHTCNQTGLYECSGEECTWNGVCDQWGCSWNPYALGNEHFYGPKRTVDPTRKVTVVTQFLTFPNGTLKEIRRLFVQDGKAIQNAAVNVTGLPDVNSIDVDYCATSASRFVPLGGDAGMGDSLARGMVLIFSVWWGTGGYMTWLDSDSAGPCNATESYQLSQGRESSVRVKNRSALLTSVRVEILWYVHSYYLTSMCRAYARHMLRLGVRPRSGG